MVKFVLFGLGNSFFFFVFDKLLTGLILTCHSPKMEKSPVIKELWLHFLQFSMCSTMVPIFQKKSLCKNITGARSVVLMSHLGRPDGQPAKDMSLAPVAEELQQLLKR